MNQLAGAQECGNEPGDSLKGIHKGWFIGVIPTFPTYHQQANLAVAKVGKPSVWSCIRCEGGARGANHVHHLGHHMQPFDWPSGML